MENFQQAGNVRCNNLFCYGVTGWLGRSILLGFANLLILLYCSQASPMSRRSRLSREELEVHQALSETDSESVRSAPLDPGQRSSESAVLTLASIQ